MTEDDVKLKDIERKVYSAYHRDGLDEMFGGAVTVAVSLLMLGVQLAILALVPLFLMAFLAAMRRQFIYPRIGYIQPSGRHAAVPQRLAIATLAVMLLLALALVYLVTAGIAHRGALQLNSSTMSCILGAATVAMLAGVGWCTTIWRWYAYAAIALLALAGVFLMRQDLMWGVLVTGVVILASGIALFVHFIRTKPRGDLDHRAC